MAGITNSWIQATVTDPPQTCGIPVTQTTQQEVSGSVSSCVLWIIVGLIIGSLTFEKKQ